MDDNSKIIFDSMKDVYQQESERNNSYVFRNYIMLILSGLLLIQCVIKYNKTINTDELLFYNFPRFCELEEENE